MIKEWQDTIGPLYFLFNKRSSADLLFFAIHDEEIISEQWFPACNPNAESE